MVMPFHETGLYNHEGECQMRKLATAGEVKRCLGIAPSTLRDWAKAKLIYAQKVGDRWLYDLNELERFKRPKRGRPIK